jgi:aminoglycoside phosphotransferase (APT) family kinase protein
LAWTTNRAFGHLDQDGKTFLACGLMSEERLFDAYQERSGLTIDRKSLHWHKVYNSYMFVTLILATGYRAARGGKTHQDILVTWALGVAGTLQAELLELLEAGD